jgi:hypothetical protein
MDRGKNRTNQAAHRFFTPRKTTAYDGHRIGAKRQLKIAPKFGN